LFQALFRPSTSNNMLWKAQHVSHTPSLTSVLCNRVPVFRIRPRPFKIPKVHSTSFHMDSSHWGNLNFDWLKYHVFKGGTVVDQSR
jgi:hypothetical protein